mmetsp:Transcript_34599/g.25766  ORF Transcript_34599/g.25766 Transcript_34599/m.25766 type:complete len:111 (-) Transcript_34599:58-390(-)
MSTQSSVVLSLPTPLHKHSTQTGDVKYTANGVEHTGKFTVTGDNEVTLSGFEFRRPVEITHLEFGVFDVETKELKKATLHKKNAMLMVYDQNKQLTHKQPLAPTFESSQL